jgi:hypothetical protein
VNQRKRGTWGWMRVSLEETLNSIIGSLEGRFLDIIPGIAKPLTVQRGGLENRTLKVRIWENDYDSSPGGN